MAAPTIVYRRSKRYYGQALSPLGYRTGLFGKYLNGYTEHHLDPRDGMIGLQLSTQGIEYFDYDVNDHGTIKALRHQR